MSKNSAGRRTATDRPSAKKDRRWVSSTALALLVALAAVALFGQRRANELELTISLERDEVYQGEILMMTLSVENVTERKVKGDKWASVGPDDCMDATGLPLELSLYHGSLASPIMQLPPEPGNLGHSWLTPGSKMELRCNIAETFNILKPGKYVLAGSYVRDPWARRAYLRLPARLWGSLVEHDPMTIDVIARRYDDPAKM